MSTAKGRGVTVYVRASTVATVTAHILCATSNSGGGVESDVIDVEPCLQDTTIERVTQDRKYTPITVQIKQQFTTTTTDVSYVMESLAGSTTQVTYIKKVPTSTPVYKSKTCYVVSFIPDDDDRGQDMTATMVLQPQSEWTNSTTAPTTA